MIYEYIILHKSYYNTALERQCLDGVQQLDSSDLGEPHLPQKLAIE